VLVFVQDSETADELATWLEGDLGPNAVARFHCGIAEKELAETAFRFQHDKQCRVLVSDELGGEGRNFQNASAVVHFGLPTSCARIEQRIGRLDRVGRRADHPVVSVVMTPATPSDEALLVVHRDVFRVFTRRIGGLEFALPQLQRQIVEAYGLGGSALQEIKKDLEYKVNATLQATDEAFDLSLDATKRELEHSIELAAQIQETGTNKTASTLRFWATRLGIDAKKRDDGTTEFRWTNGSLKVSGDRLKVGLGTDHESRLIHGTFQRNIALTHENLQYFAPGHDLVDAMIFEAEHGRHSRATAYVLEGFPNFSGTILLQVLGRSVLDERLWTSHTISPGLAARARSLLWPEVICEVMLLWDGRGSHHDILHHVGLRSYLDSPHSRLKMKALDPTIVNSLPNLPQLWAEIDEAVPIALSSIANRREVYAEERAKALEASLRAEFGFLRWRAKTAETLEHAELTQAEIAARETLIASLRRPRVDLLGLALVVLT
jgi:ATP-dependent helicase HepA